MFTEIISRTKVRNGVYATKYINGNINIQGQLYVMYSVTDAIRDWRRKNPKY